MSTPVSVDAVVCSQPLHLDLRAAVGCELLESAYSLTCCSVHHGSLKAFYFVSNGGSDFNSNKYSRNSTRATPYVIVLDVSLDVDVDGFEALAVFGGEQRALVNMHIQHTPKVSSACLGKHPSWHDSYSISPVAF